MAAALAAVVVALHLVTTGRRPSTQQLREPKPVEDWSEMAGTGQRFGPREAVLTIVEFGDYECAACRRFHSVLKEFLGSYPDDVALVYRHWPLQQHLYAYDAAQAADRKSVV
ncbi:MAG: DsbA family protein, partial [Phycisphaerales bacterium JB038]